MGALLVLVVVHMVVAYSPVRGHFKRHQAVRLNLHRSGEPTTTTTAAHHGSQTGDAGVGVDAAATATTAGRDIIVEVSARRRISHSSATARTRELAFDTVYKVGRTMAPYEAPYEAHYEAHYESVR